MQTDRGSAVCLALCSSSTICLKIVPWGNLPWGAFIKPLAKILFSHRFPDFRGLFGKSEAKVLIDGWSQHLSKVSLEN